jgi:hypothetical protein
VLSTARKFPTFDATALDTVPEITEEKAQVRQLTKAELTEPAVAALPAGQLEMQSDDSEKPAGVARDESGTVSSNETGDSMG